MNITNGNCITNNQLEDNSVDLLICDPPFGIGEKDFDSYKEKLEIIFAHKLNKNIEAQEVEIKARIDEAVASREEGDDPKEVIANKEESDEELEIEGDEAGASLPNNNAEASKQISFVERLKRNFSVEVAN